MKYLFLIIQVFLYNAICQAQEKINFDNYTMLQCKGKIPIDLTANAKINYELRAIEIEDSDKAKKRKNDEKEFYLQNNFSIQDFLLSGQILYNDTFSNYISKIADVLLKENPKLRAKLRFYTVKSPEVNAFATQEGVVFVNVGLFSAAKNEAQIAFILAHEISHYTEGHVLQGYLETKKIIRGEGYYRYMDYYSRLRSFFRYSRDSELEADKQGWVLFNQSPYAKNVVSGVFDMLLYSYLPFDSIPFDLAKYEKGSYQFPKNYHLEKTTPLFADESRDDNFSTHPNVRDRKKKINAEILKDTFGGNNYVVSEVDFLGLQKIARYEMARYYIAQTNFADAYYHTLLLEKYYGSGIYIDKIKAMSLYGLAKHLNVDGKTPYLITPYEKVQGQTQQYYYFLHQISQKETTIFALREISKFKEKYSEDNFIASLQMDMMKSLILDNKVKPEIFYDKNNPRPDSIWSENERKEYFRYAFVDELQSPLFYQDLQGFETYRSKSKPFWKKSTYKKNKNFEIAKKTEIKVDELSMFTPAFEKVISKITSQPKVDYLNGLIEKQYLQNQLVQEANSQDLRINFIEKQPEEFTTATYNEFSKYVTWIIERNNNSRLKMIYLDDFSRDTIQNDEFLGVMEVSSTEESYIVKRFHYWDFNFLVYNKISGELVFYQNIRVADKYKRKNAKKAIKSSIKTLKTSYPNEDE